MTARVQKISPCSWAWVINKTALRPAMAINSLRARVAISAGVVTPMAKRAMWLAANALAKFNHVTAVSTNYRS